MSAVHLARHAANLGQLPPESPSTVEAAYSASVGVVDLVAVDASHAVMLASKALEDIHGASFKAV